MRQSQRRPAFGVIVLTALVIVCPDLGAWLARGATAPRSERSTSGHFVCRAESAPAEEAPQVPATTSEPRAEAGPQKPPQQPAEGALLERFVFRPEGAADAREVDGKVLIQAADGGLLLIGQDGRLWTVEAAELKQREPLGGTFRPLTSEELGRQLQAEMGSEFEVVNTRHYVVCSSAGKAYAQWCATLFERLFTAFHNYWKQRGLDLVEPEFPLAALVFADEKQFAAFATRDAGPDVASAKGYFSIGTNRIVLYDLTATGRSRTVPTPQIDIARRLSAAPYNVATVIHEATHQIAFNSGMHTRYADNPLWLTEGMAMYFEMPDLTSRTGWKTVGAVNTLRLRQFRALLAGGQRGAEALQTLVQSDVRLIDPEQTGPAYAEAWALSYFLIRTRKDEYVRYLQAIAAKPRLKWDDPQQRLDEFKAAFGDDLSKLDREFVQYVRRLR